MSDFLAAFPSISMNDYLWVLSIPLITVMSCDKSRIEYEKEDEKENNNTSKAPSNAIVVNNTKDLAAAMGFNI